MARPTTYPSPAVPGPVDRESFFAAQRRHRRSARAYGALTVIGVLLVGIPLSVLLTPPLLMVAFAALHLASVILASSNPDVLVESAQWLDDTFGPYLSDPQQRRAAAAVAVPVVLVGPGATVQLVLYRRVRRLFRRAGAGGLLAELGAREPRPDDPEEHQLGNVVAEMGIAAGLPPPRVMIVDTGPDGTPATGAAVVGPGPDQATIVVGRALLDELDRAATQATIAYLVASAGNGDLHIFTTTIAARMTTHAVQYVLESRTDPGAGSVRRALLFPIRQRDRSRVQDLLAVLRDEPDPNPPPEPPRRSLASILGRPFYPLFGVSFGITSPCYSICSSILWALFMRPWQARFLRARSAYADAAAVQLLRLADPMADAVAAAAGGTHPGRSVPPTGLGGGWPTDLSMFAGEEVRASGDQWIRPRPKPGQRLWRLQRLGARMDRGAEPPRPLPIRLLLWTLAAPFVIAGYGIGLGLVGFFMSIAIFVGLLVFMMVYGCIVGGIVAIPLLAPPLFEALRELL